LSCAEGGGQDQDKPSEKRVGELSSMEEGGWSEGRGPMTVHGERARRAERAAAGGEAGGGVLLFSGIFG